MKRNLAWLARRILDRCITRLLLLTVPGVSTEESTSPFFHGFHSLASGCRRERYLQDLARGRRVLHFGFLDAPFLAEKVTSGDFLHGQLRSVATSVFGVDVNTESLSAYRRMTGNQENVIWDVQTPLTGAAAEMLLDPTVRAFDLILFAEILEHLRNPGLALDNLRQLCATHHCKLCVTVPNALSVVAFTNALRGIESVHPDHCAYYSPHTLRKVLLDSGFTDVELALYSSPDTLRSPGLTKHGVIAVASVASPRDA